MMKKILSIIAIIAGVLVLFSVAAPMIMGAILEAQAAASVGIIGGADGPTAIMLVGAVGAGSVIIEIVLGVFLIIAGIWGLRR